MSEGSDMATPLVCAESGATSEDGLDWRMYLTVDHQPAAYCPVCAAREFGGDDA